MSSVKVTNTTKSPLGLPRGPQINPGASVRVDDWEKKEGQAVAKAWIDARALIVEPISEGEVNDDAPPVDNTPSASKNEAKESVEPDPEREAQLRQLTNAELASYIEKRGGDVKSNSTKDDLVKQALSLSDEEPKE